MELSLNVEFSIWLDTIPLGGSRTISVYNADQKSIIGKFKESDSFEKGAYYLFFIDNVKGKSGDVAGYMPLQYSIGFIYDSPNLPVVAHELGHGVFNLRHTFSPEELVAKEGTTKNLMDYNGGAELWVGQWENIQDPRSMLFAWSQDESEGEMVMNSKNYIINTILKTKSHYQQNKLIERRLLPQPANSVRSNDVLIGGATYDYIDVQIVTGENSINARTIEEVDIERKGKGLRIDNSIYIFVPADQLKTLRDYITDSRKGLIIFSSGWDMLRFGSILGVGNYLDSRISEYIRQNVQNQPLEESMNVRTRFIQYLSTLTNPVAAITNSAHNSSATFADDANYWDQIDEKFISRINVPQAVYVDGSYPTTTASIDNLGFGVRINGGKDAGRDILTKIEQGLIFIDKQTPIDVVSHSMGFAYSLGIIETLQSAGYSIGWIYCIAPENAGAGYVPQNIQGIWQYGANEKEGNASVQDIIAPQSGIPNIGIKRTYFPEKDINSLSFPNCVEIHKIKNYIWIFKLESDGKVIKRNN